MNNSAPHDRHVAWLGLGSNLAQPAQQVCQALQELALAPGIALLAVSELYRTTPVGGPPEQPDYCNACAAILCSMTPLALLDILQDIEARHGRVRDVRWGPRTLDLDLLAYDDLQLRQPRLRLPHPRAARRAFVLVPLAEIAPALMLGRARVCDHLRHVDDSGVGRWHETAGDA
ncbi:MAG TPA: 2-amino-4-hydroxy-6-hydroxymethyldihydropteridine diphosphokinase [Salinisphaeraceae bacterium]|nr:2-amino-4-hydroxy-6-hydroxymethyldihydropteridine diphosphokinase [Salinisphaeraceae bacterium]